MAQDDVREKEMIALFNLEQSADRSRHGTDAFLELDGNVFEFELKSVTTSKGGLTTVRDFGPDHIAKWKNKHWIIATYKGNLLEHCRYGSPAAMAPWIEDKWSYMEADFKLAQHLPNLITTGTMHSIIGQKQTYTLADAKKLQKAQYSKAKYLELCDVIENSPGKTKGVGYTPDRMLQILKDRAKYVIERGSTLNNPHIPSSYYAGWEQIKRDHASRLRSLVRDWIAANEPQARVPLQAQSDMP